MISKPTQQRYQVIVDDLKAKVAQIAMGVAKLRAKNIWRVVNCYRVIARADVLDRTPTPSSLS